MRRRILCSVAFCGEDGFKWGCPGTRSTSVLNLLLVFPGRSRGRCSDYTRFHRRHEILVGAYRGCLAESSFVSKRD